MSRAGPVDTTRGTAFEVFRAFLRLGLTAFGGPIAHLGYFRTEFVEGRRWLDEARYADLVALCQFLPGPTSSQVGLALGYGRAGWTGALAAWCAFTLPSALVLMALALGWLHAGGADAAGIVHGLKLVAVAVVAQAVVAMARSLCADVPRAAIAVVAGALVLAWPGPGMWAALVAGLVLGWAFVPGVAAPVGASAALVGERYAPGTRREPRLRTAWSLLAFAALLLLALPALAEATGHPALAAVAGFYRSGALVFGGGHVVLPLLEAEVVGRGWLDLDTFVAGYGAAQAMPGPLFAFGAYVGSAMQLAPLAPWAAGLLLMAALFLPGALLVFAALPLWQRGRSRPGVRRVVAGLNAAVVGLLAATLYHPLWTGSVRAWTDVAVVVAAFAALVFARVPPWAVVLVTALAGWLLR